MFAISGAAPNTAMTVTFPATVSLPKLGDNDTAFTLVIDDSGTGDDIVVVGGPADGQSYTGNNLLTDATGGVSFAYGGTLSLPTDLVAATVNPFTDGTYTGTFDVTVSY